ncbi:Sds3-like-domain-containing protein [Xylariaceae sp. FL0016]|nr:Sds3-like-domain-containing protein [Xylariaceae sp. FL0016]
MAAAESSQSAAMANAKASRPSPPPQSKRDKKRQAVTDRLFNLEEQFSRDKDRHYREELQKIQVDINLVGRVDPYADRPLDEIDRVNREMSQATNGANAGNLQSRSLLEMAGPNFQEWTHQVEDLLETRDFDMTTQKYEYERKMADHQNTHDYRMEVARREHKALSETLRDRLINTITSKKWRLAKEKEALEISDSNALLLHPNQFSLTNPASPGGTHGKRNTRLRREMEELPGLAENKKRKRNAVDEDGSPAPIRRALDTSNATPLWQSERLRAIRNEAGSVYSIDKLFTDKELSMTYNTSAMATFKHLITRRDAKGNVLPTPEDSDISNGDANDDEEHTAPTMERQPSHATRSTRGGQNNQNFMDDKLLGIEGLANFEIPSNLNKMAQQEPKLPPVIASQYSKSYVKTDVNTPPSLTHEDATSDLMVMSIFRTYQSRHGTGSNLDVTNGGRELIKNMAVPQRHSNLVTYVQGPKPSTDALADHLGVPMSSIRDELAGPSSDRPAAGGVSNTSAAGAAMSRQNSLGGAAMSRAGSGRGKRKP